MVRRDRCVKTNRRIHLQQMGAGRATRLLRPTTADAVMRDHSRVLQVIALSDVVLIGHGPRPLWVSNEAGFPTKRGSLGAMVDLGLPGEGPPP